MNINIVMTFKTLTIKHAVYRDLVKAKQSGESFSDLFERMLREKRPNLLEFAGAWTFEKGEREKMHAAVMERRKRADDEWSKRLARHGL